MGIFQKKSSFREDLEKLVPGASTWTQGQGNLIATIKGKVSLQTGWTFIQRGESQEGLPNAMVPLELRGHRCWRIK